MASQMIHSFVSSWRDEGPRSAVIRTLGRIAHASRRALKLPSPIFQRQLELSRMLSRELKDTVAYGPLRGFRFSEHTWWSAADRSSMLFGMYEQEVLQALHETCSRYKKLIDLGAADGYYGVGTVATGMFQQSCCFEMNPKGQEAIRQSATLNGVSSKVKVFGTASENFYLELQPDQLSEAVLLVDIEGGEFDLMTPAVFQAFRHSVIIVEIHDWMVENGGSRTAQMIDHAGATHSIQRLNTRSRDPSQFKELQKLTDDDRWLVCSERRARWMTWLRFDPLAA